MDTEEPSAMLVGNEFARVRLTVVAGEHGDELSIDAVRTHRRRTLTAATVERLSRLPAQAYLDALRTPFGPEPDLGFSAEHPLTAQEESDHGSAETDLG